MSIQFQKVAIYDSDRRKIKSISKKSFRLFVLYAMHLKRRNSWPPDVSTLDALNDYSWQRNLAEKQALYIEILTV